MKRRREHESRPPVSIGRERASREGGGREREGGAAGGTRGWRTRNSNRPEPPGGGRKTGRAPASGWRGAERLSPAANGKARKGAWSGRGLLGLASCGTGRGVSAKLRLIDRRGRRAEVPPAARRLSARRRVPRSSAVQRPLSPRGPGAGGPFAHGLFLSSPRSLLPFLARLRPPRCRYAPLPPPPTRSARGAPFAAAVVAAALLGRWPEGGRRGSEKLPPAHAAATGPDPPRRPRDLHGRAWA